MSKVQIFTLIGVSVWAMFMWVGYFDKKNTPIVVVVDDGGDVEQSLTLAGNTFKRGISKDFWIWESQSRLNLIDFLIEDPKLSHLRKNWNNDKGDLIAKADHLISFHLDAYGFKDKLEPPHIEFIPLRGDANGLYIPQDKTLYLNSKIQWKSINFERFVEVILHENMHHIMTHGHGVLSKDHPLYSDFKTLAYAAFFHDGMAQDTHEVTQVNPQELVAYRTERAGRYAGILDGELSTWEMSARMQEIRALKKKANY
jgi:hypothetical protein